MPKLKESLEDCCIITKRYKVYDIIYSSHHSFRNSPIHGVFKSMFNQQLFIVNVREQYFTKHLLQKCQADHVRQGLDLTQLV